MHLLVNFPLKVGTVEMPPSAPQFRVLLVSCG